MMAITQIFPPARNRKKSRDMHPESTCGCTLKEPVCSLWSGIQACRHGEEGKSLAFPSRVFLSVFYECGINALLVFWQPLWAQRTEQLFPRGLFLQLCCYFPFLDQGRLWALMLRQGHPFASLTVPGEEAVIAPREASLPAPDFFLPHLGFADEGAQVCLWVTIQSGHSHLYSSIIKNIIKNILITKIFCCYIRKVLCFAWAWAWVLAGKG